MVRQTASIVVFEIMGGLVLVTALAIGALALRLSSGPLELGIFRDDVERALTRVRNGRPVSIDQVFLEWSPDDRRVIVTANDVQMLAESGDVSAEAARAEITLAASSLFFGDVEVLELDLETGWVNIDQVSATEWSIAGDPLPPIPQGELPQTSREWLGRANEVLPVVLTALEQVGEQLSLERLAFEGLELRVRGTEGADILTLTDTRGRLGRTEDGFELAVAGGGLGDGLPRGLAVDLKTSGGGERMAIDFALAEWPLAALIERLGAGRDGLTGLPSDINIAFELSRAIGVEQVVLRADAGAGRVPLGGDVHVLDDLQLIATYAAGTDELSLDLTSSRAGPLAGGLLVTIDDALLSDGARGFDLRSQRLGVDLTPQFAAPFNWTDVRASGALDGDARVAKLDGFSFNTGEAKLIATADIQRIAEAGDGTVPFTGVVTLKSEGTLTRDDVLGYWPVGLGQGARNFVNEKVKRATVTNADARLELARDSFTEGFLNDEALEVTFDIADGEVDILHDIPPVTDAAGRGRLSGNSFSIDVETGTYAGWAIDEGLVDFPKFNPRGENLRVFVKGRGAATDMMSVIANSRLDLGLEPERVTGDAEMTFELLRPALDHVPYEDMAFNATGTINNAGFAKAAFGFDLTKGTANVDLTSDGVTVTGFGDLGPAPIQFTWRDGFADGDRPSDLSATAVVTPDVLNSFGLLGRTYLSGEIPVEVQAEIRSEGAETAAVALDLDEARVDLFEIGWVKPKGVPGKASVLFQRAEEQQAATLLFDSEGVLVDADMTIGEDSKLIAATLRKAFLKDVADVTGTVSRADNGALTLELGGAFLDISGAMPELGAVGGAASNVTPMNLSAAVGTLRLRDGLDLTDARIELVSKQAGVERFEATGTTDDGSPFEALYDAQGDEPAFVSIKGGSAGFLASSFLGVDFLDGGTLNLTGNLSNGAAPTELNINIRDTQMIDAPFLTQILSLASLRGLADTLGGEGVRFSSIDIPLKIAEGRYVVDGAKAQGPALGLTASGYLNSGDGDIEFDGVLVPSFGMNSALGGVPIIGDLVVGRDGEGIFSLTYSIDGTLEKANVSVNPLSALAPGVIRRIFENPSDTTIPEATPRAPDEPIPSELPPIPEEEF